MLQGVTVRKSVKLYQKAVKVISGIHWTPQDVRNYRLLGYMAGKAAYSNRERSVKVSKAIWKEKSNLFDTRQRDTAFEIFPAGFYSCFVLVFPQYAPHSSLLEW